MAGKYYFHCEECDKNFKVTVYTDGDGLEQEIDTFPKGEEPEELLCDRCMAKIKFGFRG